MKGLAELVVSLCDLCEAEGRLLQEGVLRTVRRTVTLTLGLLFGAAALALLLAALYALLTSFMPVPAALAVLGLASAVVAACLLVSARRAAPPTPGEQPEAQAGGTRGTRADGTAPRKARDACSAGPCRSSHGRGVWAQAVPYGRPS
ncbi:hypothetical protein [uncultured Desulfovibrio sp.]|uniref:hypothetical protein n=1 Tax=uncultured Desulfovibrio sp. TaxID=167968 RepID=UPI0026302CEF|nr:hypothetical protein [uncultured Desulfovibrio sp.]